MQRELRPFIQIVWDALRFVLKRIREEYLKRIKIRFRHVSVLLQTAIYQSPVSCGSARRFTK